MIADRLLTKILKAVLDMLAQEGPPPAWRLIEGRVVEVHKEGKQGRGARVLVDVAFEGDKFFRSKSRIPLLTTVGERVEPARGTRVLVGWRKGSETSPFALACSWEEGTGGGADLIKRIAKSHIFSGSPAVGNSLVEIEGELLVTHERAGGPPPMITPLAGADGGATRIAGGDRMMAVQFISSVAIPLATPLFQITYGTQWGNSPAVFAAIVSPVGAPAQVPSFSTDTAEIQLGLVPLALPAGTYMAVVISGA